MSEAFIGEIRIFGGNFAPRGWNFCDGSTLPIAQYDALFALIGTTYGGDGQSTFSLPDLRSRAPLHQGQGPGLTPRVIGEVGGTENVTLVTAQLPAHTHGLQATTSDATTPTPSASVMLAANAGVKLYSPKPATVATGNSAATTGGSQPHSNVMPYLAVNFIIALEGIFPPQN